MNYDEEPVYYCKTCLSLSIKNEPVTDTDYCCECGSTDIGEAPIEVWEKMYEDKHHCKHLNAEQSVKNSYLWNLPYSKLMDIVFELPDWRDLILEIYPNFPRRYSKTESIMLFFDKISKENKLNFLKTLLIKKINNH